MSGLVNKFGGWAIATFFAIAAARCALEDNPKDLPVHEKYGEKVFDTGAGFLAKGVEVLGSYVPDEETVTDAVDKGLKATKKLGAAAVGGVERFVDDELGGDSGVGASGGESDEAALRRITKEYGGGSSNQQDASDVERRPVPIPAPAEP